MRLILAPASSLAASSLIAASLIASTAVAQNVAGQSFEGPPTYGEFRLSAAEMTPDASLMSVIAGGEVEVATRPGADPEDCKGFTAAASDARLVWSGPDGAIRLSAVSNADTVLVVRQPDGAFLCDDDSGEDANPSIGLTVQAGRYDVWIGTYSQGERKKAVLSAAAAASF